MRAALSLSILILCFWASQVTAAWLCDTEHGEQILLLEDVEGIYCEPVGGADTRPRDEAGEAEESCRRSLRCWLRRHDMAAGRHCSEAVQNLAEHGYQWTDGLVHSRFDARTWHDRFAATLSLAGDQIEFRSGDGSVTRHMYRCVYDPVRRRVTEVDAVPASSRHDFSGDDW